MFYVYYYEAVQCFAAVWDTADSPSSDIFRNYLTWAQKLSSAQISLPQPKLKNNEMSKIKQTKECDIAISSRPCGYLFSITY